MATQEVTLPDYVEYGGRVTAPGAFDCRGGHFRGFVLKADKDLLTAQVDKMFNLTCPRGLRFQVLSDYVLMLVGWFDEVQAMGDRWKKMGTVEEAQLSIWIPVGVGYDREDFVAERLLTACPYIFVDNPMSLAGGRETYGYPKSLGRFGFATGDDGKMHADGPMSVTTYGGNFGDKADWHPIISMKPSRTQPEVEGETELAGEEEFISDLTGLDPNQEGILPIGLKVVERAAREALKGESHQLFLKQFRDAHEPGAACYQDIITAPIRMRNTKAKLRWQKWDVDITEFDSHPICRDLGLRAENSTHKTYGMNMDFICDVGGPVTLDE
jgi:hypothetical protein